jgi:very-short-patch-repair endonuclease
VEVDGESHNKKQAYDQRRQQKLESLGLKVIRFYDDEVMKNINGVIWEIQRVIKELESKM